MGDYWDLIAFFGIATVVAFLFIVLFVRIVPDDPCEDDPTDFTP